MSAPVWARDEPSRCVYVSNASGKWELYAWDLDDGSHRQVTDRKEGTMRGALPPPGDAIWWFDDEKGNEWGQWVTQSFAPDGQPPRPAAPGLDPSYSAGLALGTEHAVIGRSVDDRTTIHLVGPDGADAGLLYEHREVAQVGGLSRDGELVVIAHSEHGDARNMDLRVVDLAGNPVAELSDGPGRGLSPLGWSRVPGDRRLLVEHERDGIGRPMVWIPEAGDEVQLSLDLPGEIEASWYPDGEHLLLVHGHRGRDELYRYSLAEASLERIEHEPGTIGAAAVRPGGAIWYSWSSTARPPQIRANTSVLVDPPGEPAPPGTPCEDLDVDGIHAFLLRPDGLPRPDGGHAPYPTLFYVHGGPEAHDSDSFVPEPQAWVDHGFAVVRVNYRGSTGYGKAWRDAIEGNPGLTELEDLAKVRAWVVDNGIADPARIALFGGSWGGYLTLLGIGRQPELWSLGIAAVPVADYVAAYEDEMGPLKAYDRALFGGSPAEARDKYEERSPITYAENVRVPVMILAGENDPRCPIRQIDNYLARLGDLDKSHEVYRWDAGHGSLVIEERLRQVEAMVSFAARHLGTAPPQ